MHFKNGKKTFSPTDLVRFFESEFASFMDHYEKVISEEVKKEAGIHRDPKDPLFDLIGKLGDNHETEVLSRLKKASKIVEIDKDNWDRKECLERTRRAMNDGADLIYQAALTGGEFFGYADLLRKISGKSKLGNYLYIPEDIKIASHPKPAAIVQLSSYCEMIKEIQGVLPPYFIVITKDSERHEFQSEVFIDFFRYLKSEFIKYHNVFNKDRLPIPDKTSDHKDWTIFARKVLHRSDDVSLTAKIRSSHIEILRQQEGIDTLTKLAKLKKERVKGIPNSTLEALKDQAQLQLKSRELEIPEVKVLEHVGTRSGLEMLPPSSKGDVFFDMEGYPILGENGLEYLYGNCVNDTPDFIAFWAHNETEEPVALSNWVKWVYERWRNYPDMHIYHYGHYETSTIQRLMGQYGIGELQIDNLLRNDVFVDLNRVVVQGIRVGTYSYSLKEIEKLYYPKRKTSVSSGADAAVQFFHFLNSKEKPEDSPFLKAIEAYNYDDCKSTQELYKYLLKLQKDNDIEYIPRTEVLPGEVEERQGIRGDCQARARELLENVPIEKRGLKLHETTEGLYLCELIAHLLEFHIREDKPGWWDYFSRFDMGSEEKYEDPYTIADCTLAEEDEDFYYIQFEREQEIKFDQGDKVLFLENENSRESYEIEEIDLIKGEAKIKKTSRGHLPDEDIFTIAPEKNDFYKNNLFRSLLTTANEFSAEEEGFGLRKAVIDLLFRKHPNIPGHSGPLVSTYESLISDAQKHCNNLNQSVLCFQGPPGAGKTYTAAHIIIDLIKNGKRVGITANSHKAILNVILKIFEEKNFEDEIYVQKVARDENLEDEQAFLEDLPVEFVSSGDVNVEAQIVGGTTFFFSRADQENGYDYLFVDEASQVSLANLVAAARSCDNIILIGDQNQLDQPIQGSHPGESGKSALSYYTDGKTTIPEDKGIFLPISHRMNPKICDFISTSFYEGKLRSHEKTASQEIDLPENLKKMLPSSGVHFLPVAHSGNMHSSPEEVKVISELYNELLKAYWTNSNGEKNKITKDDIIIVAPYNLQVAQIRKALGGEVRVASVDKFQGQEAPISILSMAASTIKDAPRGISFLFNKNRLNVAISRAKCLSIVVGSDKLLDARVSSIQSIELMNIWCKITSP